MATRIRNRRELREQADQAERAEAGAEAVATAKPKRKPRAELVGPPKPRKVRAKKAPPRMCARWGIFDHAMKQVAVFDYNQRDLADAKLTDLLVKKQGGYFMQIVKEAMPELIEALPGV